MYLQEYPKYRSKHTIEFSTSSPIYWHWTKDGILEVRKLITDGTDRYIVVFDDWCSMYMVIQFGEGTIVNNKFRWVYPPRKQYPEIESVEQISLDLERILTYYVNRDSR